MVQLGKMIETGKVVNVHDKVTVPVCVVPFLTSPCAMTKRITNQNPEWVIIPF